MKRYIDELRQLVDDLPRREPAGSQADIGLLLYKMDDVPRREREAFADAVYYYALSHFKAGDDAEHAKLYQDVRTTFEALVAATESGPNSAA